MAANWLMEPDPEIGSYDEVPWYRRTWFVTTMIFLFWPLAFVIAVSGDIFQKANRKMRDQSPAEVWRSTGTGRAVMAASGLVLAAIYGPQLYAALTADDGPSRPQTVAAEPAEQRDEPTTTTAPPADETTPPADEPAADDTAQGSDDTAQGSDDTAQGSDDTAQGSDDTPAAGDEAVAGPAAEPPDPGQEAARRRLDDVLDEARAIAATVIDTNDLDTAARAFVGDDRFAGTPIPADGRLRTLGVGLSTEDGRNAFVTAQSLTDRTVDEVAAELSEAAIAAGWTVEEREETTDEGRRTIDLDYEPKVLEGFDSISFTVEETEEGPVQARVFRFLGDPDEPTESSLVARARPSFPVPDGFEVSDVEVSLRRNLATVRFEATGPTMTESELVAATVDAAAPIWTLDRTSNGGIAYLDSDDVQATVSAFVSERTTKVTIRLE